MSSPIALEHKPSSKQALVNLHQTLSHGRRVRVLAERIAMHIEALVPHDRAQCLDIGCGDMTIAEAIAGHMPRTDWRCIDVHELPPGLRGDSRWRKYTRFDGRTIPYGDREFDVALLCDVLHHTPENAARLLAEASRVAQCVIVKDHFEYGLYSRSMLRLMDFVGNWGYGISVPERYLTRGGFEHGLELYKHLPIVRTFLRADWQFISVLRRK
jgi:hypothetical protein